MKLKIMLSLLLGSLLMLPNAFAATIDLTGTIRDFNAYNPADFEDGISGVVTGIVQPTLGIDGKPVYSGFLIGATHGATAFNQWYNDVAGVNLSMPLTITLDDTGHPGTFTYANNSFFPIDGMLLGNEGRPHNYHFTYELHSSFTYMGGEFFTFTGDDDLWVFINRQLAIDLGGVHPAATSSVNLNALGLTVGNTYDFDLFFAERHTVASSFRIDTSIALQPVPEPSTILLLGSGMAGFAGIGIMRRRKKG